MYFYGNVDKLTNYRNKNEAEAHKTKSTQTRNLHTDIHVCACVLAGKCRCVYAYEFICLIRQMLKLILRFSNTAYSHGKIRCKN